MRLNFQNIIEINECDSELSELYMSFRSMQNNKTPGNDEITKKFFVTFWDNIKVFFQNSWRAAKLKKKLSTS